MLLSCKSVVQEESRKLLKLLIFSVLIFKEAPSIIYTGLKKTIGAPKQYVENLATEHFPTSYNLRIPLAETDQHKRSSNPPTSTENANLLSSNFDTM